MTRPKLDPLLARRFRTGRACLDFVHTGGVGQWMAAELVHDANDLAWWLAYVLELDHVHARASDVAAARRLRDVLWSLAQQRIADGRLSRATIQDLNTVAFVPSLVPRLEPDGETRGYQQPVTAFQALSSLARDAIDLFSGPLGDRIRTCASPDCELLFVDASRPGRRRWCSMERCGNRARMRSYRARQD